MPLSDYAANKGKPAAAPATTPAAPSLSHYANGAIAVGDDASKNYQADFATFNAKDAVQSFLQKQPIVNGAPASPEAETQTFTQKYNAFSQTLANASSGFDIGLLSAGGQAVSLLNTAGNWLLTPLKKAIEVATGKPVANATDAGAAIQSFSDELDKGIPQEDKGYLYGLGKALGGALPIIAGAIAAPEVEGPELLGMSAKVTGGIIKSFGIGGVQALMSSNQDYKELVANGDPNALKKASMVFGVDLGLNTIAHFFGPLSQAGTSSGLLSSLRRVLVSTFLETGDFGALQPIVSNVAQGRAPMEGVWDSVLTNIPISLAFGAAGEVSNTVRGKTQEAQVKSVISAVADNGLSQGHAADVLAHLTGAPRSQVEAKVGEMVEADPALQKKFADNLTTDLPDVKAVADTLAGKVDEPVNATDEPISSSQENGIDKTSATFKSAEDLGGNYSLANSDLSLFKGEETGGVNKIVGEGNEPIKGMSTDTTREIHEAAEAYEAAKGTGVENVRPAKARLDAAVDKGIREAGAGAKATVLDAEGKIIRKTAAGEARQLAEKMAKTKELSSTDVTLLETDPEAFLEKHSAFKDTTVDSKGKPEKKAPPKKTRPDVLKDTVAQAEHEGAFIATLKKNDAFNEANKDKIAAGEVEAKPGLKEFAQMAREDSARGSSLRLAKGRKGLGEFAKALDKELTPDELDAQTVARTELAAGRDVDAKTQKLLESGMGKYKKFLETATRLSLRMEREAEKNGEPFNVKEGDAKAILDKLFKPGEVDFIFHTEGYIKNEATAGREALGMYTPGYALENPLIKMVMSDGKVQSKTLYEEAFHAYLDNFLTTSEKAALFERTKGHLLTLPGRAALKLDGYRSDEIAEEWLAHDFADYASEKAHFEGNKGFYASVVSKIREWVRKLVGAQRVYDNFLDGKRPAPRKLTVTRSMDDMLRARPASEPEAFKNFDDLSTRLLGKLVGRETVSKQFISDLTNSADLKQPEKDLIRQVLATEGGQVNVADFADRVKAQLVPLTVVRNENTDARYESIALPENERGEVADYAEKIYESPIETRAGNVHFSDHGGDYGIKNYFAHTRIEDLPADVSDQAIHELTGEGGTGTRRVIEMQSDLFQKGRLEGEGFIDPGTEVTYNGKEYVTKTNNISDTIRIGDRGSDLSDIKVPKEELVKQNIELAKRAGEIAQLEPYRNTWQERIIREEVKAAATDGKDILQFPTGETAMKIEGLGTGVANNWVGYGQGARGDYAQAFDLTPDRLKLGMTINQGDRLGADWVVTHVREDGKFNAIPKDVADEVGIKPSMSGEQMAKLIEADAMMRGHEEAFDISGKLDTDNPIYKFYEKEVGRYLKNNYGAERVTDDQGVEWYQVKVNPEEAKKPVSAFHLRRGSDDNMSDEEAALEYYRNQKAKATNDSTPASREAAKNQPVGEGEQKKSRAFDRVMERLGIEESAGYNELNRAKDTANAIDFVETNPDAARRIAEGLDLPPEGLTETSISIAYAEKMAAEGNYQAAADAERARSLRQTRRGQEIQAEQGRFNDNSAPSFMRRVMQARIEDIGKAKLRYVEGLKGKTPKQAATKYIDDEAVELRKRLDSRKLRIVDAQKLLDALTCV